MSEPEGVEDARGCCFGVLVTLAALVFAVVTGATCLAWALGPGP